MCGIVGYVGKSNSIPFMIEGLKLLEYRGYDSAGIAVIDRRNHKIEVRKECGKLLHLIELLNQGPVAGSVGIGHTRWATHGKPTQGNAHPHTSTQQDFAVVHNGIIENHIALRKELSEQGVQFRSETDTEIIPHLIAHYFEQGLDVKTAFLKTLSRLHGSFAIAMISTHTPNTIYATRRGSPLIAGFIDGEILLASDCHPLLKHTGQVFYLEENDVLIHEEGKPTILLDGKSKEKKLKLVQMDQVDLTTAMEGFDNYTQKEIHEQPSILRRIIQLRLGKGAFDFQFEELDIPKDYFNSIDRIYITACGTAYHAGFIGKYYFEEFMDLPVEVILSSEFRYAKPKLNEKNLVIAVSQSGETADTLASITEAKRHGSKVLSVVNVLNSSIDRESDGVIYTHAGPEIGVASTKAFTSQVMTLLLLAMHVAKCRGEFKREKDKELLKEIFALPEKVEQVIRSEKSISDCALKYHLATSALYLGRHLNFPIALEGALKNKEISYMHAEGYAAGEMKHGPIALIDKTLPVICICTASGIYEKMMSNVKEVEAREGIIIAVATEGDDYVKTIAREVLFVPATAEELSPILNVVALQLLAYHFAHFKGNEIDKPRNLAKSVTVE